MDSQIKLTGEYIDNDGNVTQIESTKLVNINWTSDNVQNEQVILSQELITNKIYNMDGVNKRVVQLLVKAKLEENVAPIKSSKLEIEVPEGVEDAKVVAKNTYATNGKTSLEFNDLDSSKFEYNKEDKKLYIELTNKPNENSIVAWNKDVEDEFIVTYVYNENEETFPFESNIKAEVEIYGKTEGKLEQENR